MFCVSRYAREGIGLFPVSYTEEYYEKDSEQNYENEYSENTTYVLNTG